MPALFMLTVNEINWSSFPGMVQFINSLPVAAVLEEHTSIQAYFRKHQPDPGAPYGIKPEVMDTYVRSCGV